MHDEGTQTAPHSKLVLSRLRLAAAISGAIFLVEVVGGYLSNSLALLSDAGHVLTDFLALALAWFAAKQAERPAHAGMTFGYHRWAIMAAVVNALSLVGVSGAIFYEAYHRWQAPPPVNGPLMLSVAMVGLLANVFVVSQLHGEARENLNVRGAYWHALGDALSSVGVIIAGVVILLTGRFWVDPAVSVVVGVIIVAGAWRLLREGVGVLLEAAPAHVNTEEIARTLSQVAGVNGVHDLHVWSIGPGFHALSCHVWVDDQSLSRGGTILDNIREVLAERYHINHTTLQLECLNCPGEGIFCSLVQPAEEAHRHNHQGA